MLQKIPNDKLIHFLGGYMIASIFGIWIAVAVGAVKEIYDYYNRDKHTPEWMDFAATILGGLVAMILL